MNESCRICGGTEGKVRHVREMMYDTSEVFPYFECSSCGTSTLASVPTDLGRYYPDDYYSFGEQPQPVNSVTRLIKRVRTGILLHSTRLPPPIKDRLPRTPGWARWFEGLTVHMRSRILDVGSGEGDLLLKMAGDGFSHLDGADPFAHADVQLRDGVRIHKSLVDEMQGEFDIVMFNHSLEHVPDALASLVAAASKLAEDGRIIVRVPMVDSWAARSYGADWVQYDAPRHFTLFSRVGLVFIAQKAGLRVERIFYDSTAFQFWGSEQYRMGIPLRSDRSYREHPERSPFTNTQIAEWERRAAKLNEAGQGDQAGFVLSRS
jgi:SAM-dependent methyltransferase